MISPSPVEVEVVQQVQIAPMCLVLMTGAAHIAATSTMPVELSAIVVMLQESDLTARSLLFFNEV